MSQYALIHPLSQPFNVSLSVPGSKSITNRALIIAALAKGSSKLINVSEANDSKILIHQLKKMGVDIKTEKRNATVEGNDGKFINNCKRLDVEDAGTAMRFLTALACLVSEEIIITGSKRMQNRPIDGLVDALNQMGGEIVYIGKAGFPPLRIRQNSINGGMVNIDASKSSQFVSAILMIAPLLKNDTKIICNGKIASKPYINMTIKLMGHFGVAVKHNDFKEYFIKGNQTYKATKLEIEGDASSASYLLASAAISGSEIEIKNISSKSIQSDARFAKILGQMGCEAKIGNSTILKGTKKLNGIEIDMSEMPDAAQTLSIVAAFAKGETTITGLETLQYKETERLSALHCELKKIGIENNIDENSIRIVGGSSQGAKIKTYNDHRMAMAFAVAGTQIKNIFIEAPEVVIKSYPSFWDDLVVIGVKIEQR